MIVKVQLIRHGKTQGNIDKRYIGGRTDEPLYPAGIEELKRLCLEDVYLDNEVIFSSPMKRCVETAEIIFGKKNLCLVQEFREIDFGLFEGKTHEELDGNDLYQQWIDSNGTGCIPDGESIAEFKERVFSAFKKIILEGKYEVISAVVHGGVIMAILSALTSRDYYEFMCRNGHGYVFDLSTEDLKISDLRKF